MNVLQVITGLQKAAGTSIFCAELSNGLVRSGHSVDISVPSLGVSDICTIHEKVNVIKPSVAEQNITHHAYDIVHIHGLWSPVLHKLCNCANKESVPVVWSTHGMTSPWAMHHKWWKKWLPWHLYQRRDLASVSFLHVTTGEEAKWNRDLGFKNRQIVIPLGTTLPAEVVPRVRKLGDKLRVLFVGRIYPVKGLMNVVRAAALLKNCPIGFRIVGPDQAGHTAELIAEVERLGVEHMFDWVGPRYGDELSAEYNSCDILMLPSFTENFGATVVDALAHGRPVLASRFTPWKELDDRGCGWWVSNDEDELSKCLSSIISMRPSEMNAMGVRGRSLVAEKYSWAAVRDEMMRGYEGVIYGSRS